MKNKNVLGLRNQVHAILMLHFGNVKKSVSKEILDSIGKAIVNEIFENESCFIPNAGNIVLTCARPKKFYSFKEKKAVLHEPRVYFKFRGAKYMKEYIGMK